MKEYLSKVRDRIINREDNLMNNWHWQQGVALAGLCETFNRTNDSLCMDYIKKWADQRLSAKYPGYSVNTCAPLISVLDLYKHTGEQKYFDICTDFAKWCLVQEPRSVRGAFEHTCVDNHTTDNQVWADTLFMSCIFLAKYSVFVKEAMYMHEALRQFVLHYKLLKDDKTSLIYHGFFGTEGEKRGVLWGRGNGWFAASSAIVLSLADDSFCEYETVKNNYVDYISELIKYQNADGSFNTVIDDPHSYSEMTATSAFAFAINEGLNQGILDKQLLPNAQKACSALIKNIAYDGTVLNASDGTCVMSNKDDYNKIRTCYSQYAQGLAMLALSSFI